MKKPIDVRALFPEIERISDATLRGQVVEVWEELWEQSEWLDVGDVPTSGEIAYPAITHGQCVVAMAVAVAEMFERFHGTAVNFDHLIAAAVLQDASKVVEYRPADGGKVEKTEIGKAYSHAFWAAHLSAKKGIPTEVVHVILTHSPSAPRFPDTLEGKILYYVDQLDVLAFHKDRWRKELYVTR